MSIQLWNGRDWGSLSHWNTVSISNIASWNGVEAISIPTLYLHQTKDISDAGEAYSGFYVHPDELRITLGSIYTRGFLNINLDKDGDLLTLRSSFTADSDAYYRDIRAVTWMDEGSKLLAQSDHYPEQNDYIVQQGVTDRFRPASLNNVFKYLANGGQTRGAIAVSRDGLKLAFFESIASNTFVRYFTLSTANDISTATLDGSMDLGQEACGYIDTFTGSFYYIDETVSPPMLNYVALATDWDYTSAKTAVKRGNILEDSYGFKGLFVIHHQLSDSIYVNDGTQSYQKLLKYSTIPDLTTYLKSYYAFDLNASDELRVYDGTASGISYSAGISGYCALFDAATDNVNVGNSLIANQTNLSVSLWAYHSGDPTHDELYFCRGPNGHASDAYIVLWRDYDVSGYTYRIIIKGTTTLISASEAPSGEWTHIVLTFSGTGADNEIRLFINGEEDTNSPWSPVSLNAGTNDQALIFGNDKNLSGSYSLEGYLDEVGVYNINLDQAEVSFLYNNGSGYNFDKIFDFVFREKFSLADGEQPSNYDWSKTISSGTDVSEINNSEFKFTATVAATNYTTILKSRYTLSGDFDIRWRYRIDSWNQPTSNYSWASRFTLRKTDGTLVGIFGVCYPNSAAACYAWGTSEASLTTSVTDFTTDGALRIARIGGLIKFYAYDGTEWVMNSTTLGVNFSVNLTDDIIPEFHFEAEIDSNIDVAFDDFKVLRGGWELS